MAWKRERLLRIEMGIQRFREMVRGPPDAEVVGAEVAESCNATGLCG